MAVVPQPIDLSSTIDQVSQLIGRIRMKNQTLINYYIYPNPSPSNIAAFGPRIDALASRIDSLSKISVPRFTLLVNDAPAWVAAWLLPSVNQLANAIRAFQDIFIDCYDRELEERLPYLPIFQSLNHIADQLQQYQAFILQNPQRRTAAQLNGQPTTTQPVFCKAAVAYLNNQDQGRIRECLPADLTADNRSTLRAKGGLFLWWECQLCAFRLRFHISDSMTANITITEEIRSHPELENVRYRSAWLAKSHLYHLGREVTNQVRDRRRCSASSPFAMGCSNSASGSSGGGVVTKGAHSPNTYAPLRVKYGCPFCVALGADIEPKETAFPTAREYAAHLNDEHGGAAENLPPALLLVKFGAAVRGQPSPDVKRWDIDFC